jgi:cytochrome c oxidase assembly factor CtaG
LGRPVTLLLRVTCARLRNHLKHALRSRLVSALTWLPAAAALYAAVVIGTHLTPLMNLVLENTAVHEAEHALYLVTGYLYFLPVIDAEPIRWRPTLLGRFLLLLATMPVDTLVGVVLILASHQLFPAYPDLHQGGLIMLAGGDLIMTVLAVALPVSVVQDRGTPRGDVPGDLDAYNAHLASLDSRKLRPPRGRRDGARSGPSWASHDGDRIPGPERAGLPASSRRGPRSRGL